MKDPTAPHHSQAPGGSLQRGRSRPLLEAAEAHARTAGAARIVLWTDTRFEAAHRFYEKRGYVRQGSIRILDDLSNSLEFRYAKPLKGLVVEALDAAAAGVPPALPQAGGGGGAGGCRSAAAGPVGASHAVHARLGRR